MEIIFIDALWISDNWIKKNGLRFQNALASGHLHQAIHDRSIDRSIGADTKQLKFNASIISNNDYRCLLYGAARLLNHNASAFYGIRICCVFTCIRHSLESAVVVCLHLTCDGQCASARERARAHTPFHATDSRWNIFANMLIKLYDSVIRICWNIDDDAVQPICQVHDVK